MTALQLVIKDLRGHIWRSFVLGGYEIHGRTFILRRYRTNLRGWWRWHDGIVQVVPQTRRVVACWNPDFRMPLADWGRFAEFRLGQRFHLNGNTARKLSIAQLKRIGTKTIFAN